MAKNNRLTNGYDSINVLNGLVFLVFIGATNVVLFNVVQRFLLSFQSKIILECVQYKSINDLVLVVDEHYILQDRLANILSRSYSFREMNIKNIAKKLNLVYLLLTSTKTQWYACTHLCTQFMKS